MNRELKPMCRKSTSRVAEIDADVHSFTHSIWVLRSGGFFDRPAAHGAASFAAIARLRAACHVLAAIFTSFSPRAADMAPRKGKNLGRTLGILVLLAGLHRVPSALAFGAQGHEFSGAVADQLLNRAATSQVARLLGMTLQAASTWADCVKNVLPGADGWRHVPDEHFHFACQAFETAEGIAQMIDFAKRNSNQCDATGRATACHRDYHFTDVAIQHDRYDRAFVGTGDHDVVSALNAAIAVLRGQPAPAPFGIRDQKEALLMLAHFIGDVHQPLHVGALYLGADDLPVDPDAHGLPLDPKTSTRGGNSIADGLNNLHAEWDAVPASLRPQRIGRAVLAQARRVAPSPHDPNHWPAAWAGETLLVSRAAFDGLSFRRDATRPGQWTVQFPDRDAYLRRKAELQTRQLIKAGARLAQVLNTIWP